MSTNKGQSTDLTELVLFDPETEKEEVVERDQRDASIWNRHCFPMFPMS